MILRELLYSKERKTLWLDLAWLSNEKVSTKAANVTAEEEGRSFRRFIPEERRSCKRPRRCWISTGPGRMWVIGHCQACKLAINHSESKACEALSHWRSENSIFLIGLLWTSMSLMSAGKRVFSLMDRQAVRTPTPTPANGQPTDGQRAPELPPEPDRTSLWYESDSYENCPACPLALVF